MERSSPERLGHVRVVLLDLDGVLYVEQALVPGARDAVELLRSLGLGLRFVTNTTSHSRPDTLRKLHRLGGPAP
jgi:ribonucleotide monophosphatase NagD (HAD superfamily)